MSFSCHSCHNLCKSTIVLKSISTTNLLLFCCRILCHNTFSCNFSFAILVIIICMTFVPQGIMQFEITKSVPLITFVKREINKSIKIMRLSNSKRYENTKYKLMDNFYFFEFKSNQLNISNKNKYYLE